MGKVRKTGKPMSEFPNLRAYSPEEARLNGIKGGKARWAKARERKSLAEELKNALNATIQPSHPKYAEIKRMLRSMGLGDDGDPTNQLIMVAGLLTKAQKDPSAATFVRDTVGERPVEKQEMVVNAPPVQIGIHDPSFIAEERVRQAEAERIETDAVADAPETPRVASDAVNVETVAPTDGTPSAASVARVDAPRPQQTPPPHPPQPKTRLNVPIAFPLGRR